MERKSQIELTNMCLVCDETRILVEEKRGTSYPGGLIFPGGHVEKDESLRDSVIREIREETGLTIRNPKLCGVKDWIEKDGTRYLVLLYKTNEFEGELKKSCKCILSIETCRDIWNRNYTNKTTVCRKSAKTRF